MKRRIEEFINPIYLLLIVIASIALYFQSTSYEFVLDDKIVLSENTFVKEGVSGIKDILTTDSFTGYFGGQQNLLEGGRYRPLSLVLFAVEYEIFGLDSYYFHLFSILYYSLLSILIYFFLIQLFNTKILKRPLLQFLSFIGALIFLVHPLHTEVVANIKGRDEVLALLFSILGAISMFKYYDTKKTWLLLVSLISLFLAFLSKEHSLAFVFIIPLSLFYFRDADIKKLIKLAAILFIPAILFFIVRYQALGLMFNTDINQTGIMNNPYIDADFGQKIATISYTLLLYLKLLFVPHPLTHDYYPYQIPLLDFISLGGLLSILSILAIGVYSAYGVIKKHYLAFLILFYFASIFMMSNIIFNVGTFMNERFMFMGSVIFPILIIWVGKLIIDRKEIFLRYISAAVIIILVTGFTYKSYNRIPAWNNTESLNRAAVKVSKNSARANCFMGVWLYEEMLKKSDNDSIKELIGEAKIYIDKSLSIYPEYADALTMKLGIATQTYRIDKDVDKLLEIFYEVLTVRHINFIDEYLEWLVRRTPNEKIIPFLYKSGYKLMAKEKGDLTKAVYYLNMGYNKDNTSKNILFGLTIVNYMSRDYKAAVKHGNQFLAIDNTNADILYYIGLSYNSSSEFDKGTEYLERAYKIKPELRKK